ncbi:enoyl-CoA hydratase-related protein [Hydrocarboniphaga sp.]|uniref:enoyl-CoA hydratase-related protein n=1 Tax=Hydrocarboniphaga sp. TaxID=2033016 RepID=UPI00260E327B|nr:enoyl-CoA hydratase-related protein [Hydrocarboniphaga sp.]
MRIERDGAVGIVVLDRPERRNAMDLSMRAGLAAAVHELDQDPGIRALVITGSGGVFAAGADLKLLADKGAQDMVDLDLGQYWAPLLACTKPVIAAVSGFALGAGCELAMMCDIVVGDPSARFGQPEAKVGIMPGAGGTQRLVRAVGKPIASLMLMTGEMIAADRAAQLGLISELVAEGEALRRARELAQAAAAMPPRALRAIKRVLAQGADLPLDAALSLENREFLLLFDTQDKTEGMRAFIDKRKPRFSGK